MLRKQNQYIRGIIIEIYTIVKKQTLFAKTFLPLACCFILNFTSCSQVGDMPQFKITQANGEIFKASDLKTGRPTLLIYFSPECEHCQTLMKEFFKKADAFSESNILMITFLPADRVVSFVKEYPVAKYTNITVGTEGMGFLVRDHLGIQNMPFAAIYDKKNKLISKYERDIPLDEILVKIK